MVIHQLKQNVTDVSFCVDVLRATNMTPCSVGNVSSREQRLGSNGHEFSSNQYFDSPLIIFGHFVYVIYDQNYDGQRQITNNDDMVLAGNIGEPGCSRDHHCQDGALCIDGSCQCPAGYLSVSHDSKCAKEGGRYT